VKTCVPIHLELFYGLRETPLQVPLCRSQVWIKEGAGWWLSAYTAVREK